MRIPGSISNFAARVYANSRTTNTVFQMLKNGSTIGNGVTFGSTATGYTEDSGLSPAVAMALDDTLSIRLTTGTGTQSIQWTVTPILFEPTNDEFQCGVTSEGIAVAAGTTRYFPLIGECSNVTTTEDYAKAKVPFAMTVDRFRAYMLSNSLTGGDTATLNIRVNGSTVRTITWAAGVTGAGTPSDSSAVSLFQGDEVNYSLVCTGASGSVTFMSSTFRGVASAVANSPDMMGSYRGVLRGASRGIAA
jgi:hypothetical protein